MGLEDRWAPYAAQWREELDRLAEHAPAPDLGKRPDGFPADRAEAFAQYAEARRAWEAATAQAGRAADVAVLRERERQALAQLRQAQEWLAAWGISDADQAWFAAEDFSAGRASGLAAGARGRGRGRGNRARGRGGSTPQGGQGQGDDQPAEPADDPQAQDAPNPLDIRHDDPLLAEVVRQWRALDDLSRGQSPQTRLTAMLAEALQKEGKNRNLRRWGGYKPGPRQLFGEQIRWLRDRLAPLGLASDTEIGRQLGFNNTTVATWRRELGLPPLPGGGAGAGHARSRLDLAREANSELGSDPRVVAIVAQWRARSAAERRAPENRLVAVLEQRLGTGQVRLSQGSFLRWAGDLVTEQVNWLFQQLRHTGGYSSAEVGRQLGVPGAYVQKVLQQQGISTGRGAVDAELRNDQILTEIVDEWRALSEADRFENPLVQFLEWRLQELGDPRRLFTQAAIVLPWTTHLLRDQVPWILRQRPYNDSDIFRQLGVNLRREWRTELGLVRWRDNPVDPASRDETLAAIVEEWQRLAETDRLATPLLRLLEKRFAEHDRAVYEGRGYAAGVPELLFWQAWWLLGQRDYNGAELADQLGIRSDLAALWRQELALARLGAGLEDHPVVADVVAEWRALAEQDRTRTPLVSMLTERLGREGLEVRAGLRLAPGVTTVLQRQVPWLLGRQPYDDIQLGRQLGVGGTKMRELRAGVSLSRHVVRSSEPLVVDVVQQWRLRVAAGGRQRSLLSMLEEALDREGRRVRYERGNFVLVPGMSGILQQQLAWLLGRRDYRHVELAPLLGVSSSTVGSWRTDPWLTRPMMRSDDPSVVAAVAQWRESGPDGRIDMPLTGLLAQELDDRAPTSLRRLPGAVEVFREQAEWLLDNDHLGPSDVAGLAGQLGVTNSEATALLGRLSAGAPVVRPDDPVVASVVARWQGLSAERRRFRPLLGMLARRMAVRVADEDGGPLWQHLLPGVPELLIQQLGWLLDQHADEARVLARQIGVPASVIEAWRRALGRPAVPARAPVAADSPRAVSVSGSELTSLPSSPEAIAVDAPRGSSIWGSDLSSLAESSDEFDGDAPARTAALGGRQSRNLRAGRLVAEWEEAVHDAGWGMEVTSLREYLHEMGTLGFRRPGAAGAGYAFTPEWWEVFRNSAVRWWAGGSGTDPRTDERLTEEGLASLLGTTPAVVRLWLEVPGSAGAVSADAMDVDEDDAGAVRVSPFAPEWARSGRPFFELVVPERVTRREDLRISADAALGQLDGTAQLDAVVAWEVRNLPGGAAAVAAPVAAGEDNGVGFLVTLLVPYRTAEQGYGDEWRSPRELVEMFQQAAGLRWQSRLRMVIGINRFNDHRRSKEPWAGEGPYGTTARLEAELAAAVAFWQREVDAVAPGIATVIGQVVEPPVWDHGRLVDPDVLRDLLTQKRARSWRKFPFAGLRQAMLASGEALTRMRELWRLNEEVWIHIGDGDVIDLVNPAGGNELSLLARYTQEIRASAPDGPSPLVRLGGGYAFSPRELEYGPRRGQAPGEAEQISDATKLTLLLVEADNLQRALMSQGRWPRGYFSEQNTLLNSRYLEQFISAAGQEAAKRLTMPDLFLGLHARLGQLGLLSDEHSRFLADPAARLLTSAHGRRSQVRPEDTRGMLQPRRASGRITGFRVMRRGRTLREFSRVVARHGLKSQDRNMTFRPVQYLRVGKAMGLVREGSLFDPDARPRELARRLRDLRSAATPAADRMRAHLLDTGPKAAAAAQLTSRVEAILEHRWTEPLADLLAALSDYASEPLPDWYAAEFGNLADIDPTDAELSQALDRLALAPSPRERQAPDQVLDGMTAILRNFTTLTIGDSDAQPGPEPGTGSRAERTRAAAERRVLEDYPELEATPDLVRRVQLANLSAQRQFQDLSAQRRARYRDFRRRLAESSRRIPVRTLGDCYFEAVLEMAGDHLAAWGVDRGRDWEGGPPTVAEMRLEISDAVRDSFEQYRASLGQPGAESRGLYVRRMSALMALEQDEQAQRALLQEYLNWIETLGEWDGHLGDHVVGIAADLWQLPLTALGPDVPLDYGPGGPASDGSPRGYLLYNGSHYEGVSRDDNDPALPAAELLSLPERPEFVIPGGVDPQVVIAQFDTAFGELHRQAAATVTAAVTGVPATGRELGDMLDRLDSLRRDFDEALDGALAAAGDTARAGEISRMSSIFRHLGDVLRRARTIAAGAAGPSRQAKRSRDTAEDEEAARPAKRGRLAEPAAGEGVTEENAHWEDDAEAEVPDFTDQAPDVNSPEFGQVVRALGGELYGSEPAPDWLPAAIAYLVKAGGAQEFPATVAELAELVAFVTGRSAGGLRPAEVRALLPGLRVAAERHEPGFGAAGRPGVTGVRLEEAWAPYAAQWNSVLDELADAPAPNPDEHPDGFPADRAEAFAEYARARLAREAATDRVDQSGRSSDAGVLRDQEREAQVRLDQAHAWLAAWGIADAERAWQAAEDFSAARGSGLSAGARGRRPGQPMLGAGAPSSDPLRLRGGAHDLLDGGFMSVADTVQAELDPWLRDRLRVSGVFDLALAGTGGALSTFGNDAPDEPMDADELARRLPGWGIADGDAIRLVTPSGSRLEGLMTELAGLRGRPVLRTPVGANLALMSWPGRQGTDLAPASLSGYLVPWRVSWPRDSWEHQHGHQLVAADGPFSNAFVVGLHAGSDGLMLFYNGEGGGFVTGYVESDYLRVLGWDGQQPIVLVTERWPGAVIDGRLRDLSEQFSVSVSYRLAQGFAGLGSGALVDRLHLLRPEPGLFDLLLGRDEEGELRFGSQGEPPFEAADLPDLPGDRPEVRLVVPDGENVRDEAAALAQVLDRPVWIKPAGATFTVHETGKLMAIDPQTGEPVAWEQITPLPVAAAAPPPWYDTTSGRFEVRRGDALVERRREPAGAVEGIVLAGQERYNEARMMAPLPHSHPADLYVANVVIDRDRPGFLRTDFDGSKASRPLSELPRLLEAHGWTPYQHILVATDFTDFPVLGNETLDQQWDAITREFAEIARLEGVSVVFPARGSSVRSRYGDNELVVTGAADPRWDRRDPAGEPADLLQDPAGRLRERSDPGPVALALSGSLTVDDDVRLRRGVASPTREMIRARSHAYDADAWSDDDLQVFVLDVPLTDAGHLGLVFPGDGGSEPGWRVEPATAAQVLDLAAGSGYRSAAQALQILAAPRTQAQYEVFVWDAQQVADQIGRAVYIVGAAGATVAYHEDRPAFVARADRAHGQAIGWRLLWPNALDGPPGYFETDDQGMRRFGRVGWRPAASRVREPGHLRAGVPCRPRT